MGNKATQVGVAANNGVKPFLSETPDMNGAQKVCPVCPENSRNPYGLVTAKIGCCSKLCSEKWDGLPFDEKQRLLDAAELRVQELARAARPHVVAQAA